jgi:carbonic anhydrase
MMQDYSVSLAEAVAAGRCAIVGLQYALADGTVHLVETAGQI